MMNRASEVVVKLRVSLLFLICISLLTACQKQETTAEERHQHQELALNLFSEPPTMDPGLSADGTSTTVLLLLFEGLNHFDVNGQIVPAVAETIAISDDRKTYTFHLRDTAWSNGAPLTAHDFEYAWKRVLDPNWPGELSYHLYFIKGARAAKEKHGALDDIGVHAIDDRTLTVELEHPTPFFLELLCTPPYMPVHRATVERNPNWAFEAGRDYISNGPFTLDTWTHSNQLLLTHNPHYWESDKVKLNRIQVFMIDDANTELSLFLDGAIDWAGKPISLGLPTDSLDSLRASGRLKTGPYPATNYFLLNIDKQPFTSAKIRRAFAYAANRRDIVKNILKSGEQIATCIVPPSMSLHNEGCFQDANVKEARQLFEEGLKELGMVRKDIPLITISHNTGESHHKMAQALQQQWSEAFGIPIALENQEWKVYLDKLTQRDFTVARMTWHADYNDPFVFLDMFKQPDGMFAHYTGWNDPAFSKLIEKSLETTDEAQRKALLAQAERRIVNQMPVIPINYLTTTYLSAPSLQGFFFVPTGMVDFRYAYFE